jgi:integrase/recombinase XerD
MTALLLPPQPIETLTIPPELDGSAGKNRAKSGVAQIAARNDLDGSGANRW